MTGSRHKGAGACHAFSVGVSFCEPATRLVRVTVLDRRSHEAKARAEPRPGAGRCYNAVCVMGTGQCRVGGLQGQPAIPKPTTPPPANPSSGQSVA